MLKWRNRNGNKLEKGVNIVLKKIQGIIFDADNTLIDHKECEKQALQYLFTKIGENYIDEYQNVFRPLDRELWNNVALNKSKIPSEQIPEYRFKVFFEKLHIKYDDYKNANEIFKYGLEHFSGLTPNAKEILEYLSSKDYKLYVISDGLTKLQKSRIVNCKIDYYFTDIIVSEEVGASKPNPIIFNTLLKRNNLNSKDVIMVGDSLEKDIQGAKNANIRTIWYNPEQKINNTNIKPDVEIKDLFGLKNLL